VHGAGGNVLNFRDLSRGMNRAQPFYGLQASGTDGVRRPHGSIAEMATAYLAEVRALQPRGPYLLGGYSGGCIVAFEMARLLATAGEGVALLALIDTYAPQMPVPRMTALTRLARVRDEGMSYVVAALRRQHERVVLARNLRAIERSLAAGQPIPFALREHHLIRNFRRAVSRYQPERWPGRAVLFRAAEIPYLCREGGPTYGWNRLLDRVEVVAMPGSHHTLLLGKNVAPLVGALDAAIERAQGSAPGAGGGSAINP
jgi:thioesterase domain-containing protein